MTIGRKGKGFERDLNLRKVENGKGLGHFIKANSKKSTEVVVGFGILKIGSS